MNRGMQLVIAGWWWSILLSFDNTEVSHSDPVILTSCGSMNDILAADLSRIYGTPPNQGMS